MAVNIEFDTKDFERNTNRFLAIIMRAKPRALFEVGLEIMRLSSFEVPHDKGLLQNSGSVEPQGDDVIVGYNKEYAARLHEHPEYRFQKGRKGKYLEDPIKKNLKPLLNHFGNSIKGSM